MPGTKPRRTTSNPTYWLTCTGASVKLWGKEGVSVQEVQMTERWRDQLVEFTFWFIRSPFLWYAIFGAIVVVLATLVTGCRPNPEEIPMFH